MGFIEKNDVDFLFLVIRQFPLMPLHKPLIKYENSKGGINWMLHPALLNRKLNWNEKLTEYHTMHEYVHKEKARFGFRDMNLLAGYILGLYDWASRFVLQEVLKVRDFCKNKNISLIVLSTQQYPTSFIGNLACKRISAIQGKQFAENHIQFINIIDLGTEYFSEDMVHFSAECHALIAEKLFGEFKVLICGDSRMNIRRKPG